MKSGSLDCLGAKAAWKGADYNQLPHLHNQEASSHLVSVTVGGFPESAFCLFVEAGSPYFPQADLELTILLPQPPYNP